MASPNRPLPITQGIKPRGLQPNAFIWATPLRGEATQHIITHLLACFAVMGTSTAIKTDNGPACISGHFKQFLQSFPVIHIIGIPYNPDIRHSQTNTSCTKVTNKKIKKGGIHRHTTVFLI